MGITKEEILKALGTVEDPDLKKDLVTLNMIKDLSVDDAKISFSVVLTTPACPLKELIKKNCIGAIQKVAGESIQIVINMTSNVTTTRNNSLLLPNVKNIIAVASGKGGVGKSTVTANLAVALAKSGAHVGIIDADYVEESFMMLENISDSLATISNGERIAQCLIEKTLRMEIVETTERPEQKTDRDGGFGSTGTE